MIYLKHLLEATDGILSQRGKQIQFTAFSHDTRQLTPGELFVAVRGIHSDGHDYLLDAVHRGASGLLVEEQRLKALPERTLTQLAEADVSLIVVKYTRQALRQYTSFILRRWHPTVIAVTGSVGKTSTKEAIATVLARRFATFRSWQNYNDLLGIPLSLGRLEAQHEYAVLELGRDRPGEIADLCRMVQPRIGVLTNISPVQLQYFGSIERLATEFSTLLTSLPDGGHFFYNQDDATIREIVRRYKAGQTNDITFHPLVATATQVTYLGRGGIGGALTEPNGEDSKPHKIHLASHLLGKHNMSTMLAAYHVGRNQGMHVEEIVQALQKVRPMQGRLNPLPGIRGSWLLDDTHNSAPESVIAGLATLHTLTPPGGCRIAVLGDMLNLGSYEEEEHRRVGQQAVPFVDYLIVRGELAAILAEAAQQAGLDSSHIVVTSTHEDAAQAVKRLLQTETSKQYMILVKGSEETRMERVTELLMAQPWEASEKLVRQTPGWKKTIFRHADRPTWVEVDLNAIGNNTRQLKAIIGPEVQILVSLKADAYGHGALKVARTVLHNGASMLGVATVSEAIPLREGSITAPILVFGYVPHWQMREAVRLDVTVTLYTSEAAQELSRAAQELGKVVKVHLKIDTGMSRLGIRSEQRDEIVALLREIQALPGLELEGIYTHFANADEEDLTYAHKQLARFQEVLQVLESVGLCPSVIHAANSAATFNLPEARFNMVRPGIAIYGLDPSPEVHLPEGFRAALSFKTQVSQVKVIPTGEAISYGCTYITERPTIIAVLPVGYADGFRRAPRNWGYVLIHEKEAPILGRVCMDQCMVDITHIPETRIGDEVVLIGHQGKAALAAEKVAEQLGTINYEVVSEILARVPRVD